jgi:hypothetical protein
MQSRCLETMCISDYAVKQMKADFPKGTPCGSGKISHFRENIFLTLRFSKGVNKGVLNCTKHTVTALSKLTQI